MSFVINCGILWHPAHTHTLLCNPAGPRQFCALLSECIAFWQRQQLNASVRLASSVVDMLGANISCHCWWPCTISARFHGITHIPIHRHQLGVDFYWCNSHHIQKSKHNSYFKVCHVSGRHPSSIYIRMVSTHSCTMTQSTCAHHMLKSAVPWYYCMSDMRLPYFLNPPCVLVKR